MFKKFTIPLIILFTVLSSIFIVNSTKAAPAGTVGLYKYFNGLDHFYITSFEPLGNGKYGYTYQGIQGYVFREQQPDTTPFYRYYNGTDHFYTVSYLGSRYNDYSLEGTEGYIYAQPHNGTTPLFRYYNGTDHYYTTDFNELRSGSNGYTLEGIEGYIFPN
ncbi:hypothetical protein [Paenibacillus sp. A3]|uniref:hypothetical protein n=1 Tax=Paenibacillus sp. A3 TaxID=1337054 RepID=UPI000A88394F|nr:hypothetical protein [Paenibacillus sp. A3]